MENYKIHSSADLKAAIAGLELRNKAQWIELKEEANELYEKVAPIGRAVVAVSEILSKPELKENVFNTALTNVVDFLAKRLIIRGSENRFRIMLANAAKFAVLRFFSSQRDAVQSTFTDIKDAISHKFNKSAFTNVRDFVMRKIHRIKRSFS